jgi:hypothetical protein
MTVAAGYLPTAQSTDRAVAAGCCPHRICGTGVSACGYATRWHNDGMFEILRTPTARLLARAPTIGRAHLGNLRAARHYSLGMPGSIQ